MGDKSRQTLRLLPSFLIDDRYKSKRLPNRGLNDKKMCLQKKAFDLKKKPNIYKGVYN